MVTKLCLWFVVGRPRLNSLTAAETRTTVTPFKVAHLSTSTFKHCDVKVKGQKKRPGGANLQNCCHSAAMQSTAHIQPFKSM